MSFSFFSGHISEISIVSIFLDVDYLRYCGKNSGSCTRSLYEEICFEYRSVFPKIKSHNLKSMLETSMKLAACIVIAGMCVPNMNNLGE